MSKKKIQGFVRRPASTMVLQEKLNLQREFNAALLDLIAANFPALQGGFSKLQQQFAMSLSKLDAMEGELTLSGHGPRGVARSLGISTEADEKAFQKCCKKPAVNPLQFQDLIAKLQSYLTLDNFQENGNHTKHWVVPDASMFGHRVKTGDANSNLLDLNDGIYVIPAGDDGAVAYSLRITIDDGIFIFSPALGPSIVTYSEIEQCYVQHNAWRFVDGPSTLTKIDDFFRETNARDISTSEMKKIFDTMAGYAGELPANVKSKSQREGEFHDVDFEIDIEGYFTLRLPNVGQPSITSIRDDIQWDDLSYFTRRTLFRNAVKDILNLKVIPKGTLSSKKKVAKKTIKGKK